MTSERRTGGKSSRPMFLRENGAICWDFCYVPDGPTFGTIAMLAAFLRDQSGTAESGEHYFSPAENGHIRFPLLASRDFQDRRHTSPNSKLHGLTYVMAQRAVLQVAGLSPTVTVSARELEYRPTTRRTPVALKLDDPEGLLAQEDAKLRAALVAQGVRDDYVARPLRLKIGTLHRSQSAALLEQVSSAVLAQDSVPITLRLVTEDSPPHPAS